MHPERSQDRSHWRTTLCSRGSIDGSMNPMRAHSIVPMEAHSEIWQKYAVLLKRTWWILLKHGAERYANELHEHGNSIQRKMGSGIVCVDQIQPWRIGRGLIAAPRGRRNWMGSQYGEFGPSNKSSFNESRASTFDCSYGSTLEYYDRSAFISSYSRTRNESF